MEITINLTEQEIKHLNDGNHTFYDCCSEVESVMKKVIKEIIKGDKAKLLPLSVRQDRVALQKILPHIKYIRITCDKCQRKVTAGNIYNDDRFYCLICGQNLGIHYRKGKNGSR